MKMFHHYALMFDGFASCTIHGYSLRKYFLVFIICILHVIQWYLQNREFFKPRQWNARRRLCLTCIVSAESPSAGNGARVAVAGPPTAASPGGVEMTTLQLPTGFFKVGPADGGRLR